MSLLLSIISNHFHPRCVLALFFFSRVVEGIIYLYLLYGPNHLFPISSSSGLFVFVVEQKGVDEYDKAQAKEHLAAATKLVGFGLFTYPLVHLRQNSRLNNNAF